MKKDYWYAAIIGLITAFFARLIFVNSETPLHIGFFVLPLWSLFIILPIGEFIAYIIASKLFSRILVLKQLGRFGIVGLMNFSVDTGILTTLSVWTGVFGGARLLPLNITSAIVAIVNSYFWQRTWTFSEKVPPTRKEFMGFVMITVIGIAINTIIVTVLPGVVPPFDGLTPARLEVVAKIGATVVTLFWNFFGYKFFVFKS